MRCAVAMVQPILYVFILSLAPSFEGRYAILVGAKLGLPPLEALIAASLGILVLSTTLPLVLPSADRLAARLAEGSARMVSGLARRYLSYVERVRARARPYVEKYGFLGLSVFVAIPLPGTGVWTGAIAGYILGIPKKRLMLALLVGGLASNILSFLAVTAYNWGVG